MKGNFEVGTQADQSMCSCLYETKRIYEGYEKSSENCTSKRKMELEKLTTSTTFATGCSSEIYSSDLN